MSADQIKFIVTELNKDPFNRNYNLISFDALEALQLLQVLTDVLSEIDPKQKVDVREEAADQTAVRILGILRILKFKPPTDSSNLSEFRQGIVQGTKIVIYPILEWLIQKLPELKKRAYLARFLIKIDVPEEFAQENHVAELNSQYVTLINDFKEKHRALETLRSSGFSTDDIKKDIASMDDEKEQLIKRVERLKRKVEAAPNSAPMLSAAQKLRQEKDRNQKIHQQKHDQKNEVTQFEQRSVRLQTQLKETRQASIGATAEGLVQRLEEENKVNVYMVKDKMPKEIESSKKIVQNLQRVVAEPAMGRADLDPINKKIKDVNAEVNQLVEKRMMASGHGDDKSMLFRQQAAIIARKKESAAETLQESREEYARIQIDVSAKQAKLKEAEGGEAVLKGDEFKRYINQLRGKSVQFKEKRLQHAELKAETGVLSRTEEILKQRDDAVNKEIEKLESKKGISGFRQTQEAIESVSALKAEMDALKGKTLEDISVKVQKLNRRIQEKKSALAPIIKELRPLRQKAQEVQHEYDEKKGQYDSLLAGYESNRSKLEQEVRVLREESSAETSRFHYIIYMEKIIKMQQKKVQEEMKSYINSGSSEKKKPFREIITKKIQEQDNLSKGLKEKQKQMKENFDSNITQVHKWRNFQRLISHKLNYMKQNGNTGDNSYSRNRPTGNRPSYEDGADTLVL